MKMHLITNAIMCVVHNESPATTNLEEGEPCELYVALAAAGRPGAWNDDDDTHFMASFRCLVRDIFWDQTGHLFPDSAGEPPAMNRVAYIFKVRDQIQRSRTQSVHRVHWHMIKGVAHWGARMFHAQALNWPLFWNLHRHQLEIELWVAYATLLDPDRASSSSTAPTSPVPPGLRHTMLRMCGERMHRLWCVATHQPYCVECLFRDMLCRMWTQTWVRIMQLMERHFRTSHTLRAIRICVQAMHVGVVASARCRARSMGIAIARLDAVALLSPHAHPALLTVLHHATIEASLAQSTPDEQRQRTRMQFWHALQTYGTGDIAADPYVHGLLPFTRRCSCCGAAGGDQTVPDMLPPDLRASS